MRARGRRVPAPATRAAIRAVCSVAADEAAIAADLLGQLRGAGTGLLVVFCTMTVDLGRLGALLRQGGRESVIGAATGRAIGAAGFLKHGVTGFLLPASRFAAVDAVIERPQAFGPGDAANLVRHLHSRIEAGAGARYAHRFGLLLVDAEPRCEEPLTAALGFALSGVPLAGGSAGDVYFNPHGQHPESARVLYGDRALQRAAVFCLIATDAPVRAVSHHHFTPGRRRVVITEADPSRRVISEINGRPALDEYAAACGLRVQSRDPGDFASHPLMIRIGGQYFARGIQRIHDDGTLEFACAVEPGIVVTIARSGDMRARLAALFDELSAAVGPLELAIGFDCAARTAAMERAGHTEEITAIMRRHHVCGFATLGEQFGAIHVNNSFSCVAIGTSPDP